MTVGPEAVHPTTTTNTTIGPWDSFVFFISDELLLKLYMTLTNSFGGTQRIVFKVEADGTIGWHSDSNDIPPINPWIAGRFCLS